MKIEQIVHESRSSGVAECKPFDVVANASMMQILSDKIYSDKIKAPIQELSANAIDAHEAAGKADVPFDVHIPTYEEPYFSIRDYGTGMCQEHVEELYRIYGASEKIASNKLIGCMGIGSKSPFAYCDLFNVTSYHNGKKMVYVCAKDRRGMPTLNRMCIEDTDESNGVEITFQCKTDERWGFKSRAEQVFRWFNVKPNCNVDLDYKQFEVKEMFSGDDWEVYSDDASYCIMGNIAYKIDATQFSSDDNHYSYGYDQSQDHCFNLLRHGVVIHVELGSVDFEAGREGLSYSQHTKDAIRVKLDKVRDELSKELLDHMQNHDCLWDARVEYRQFRHGKHNVLVRVCGLNSQAEWNGHSLKDSYKLKDVGIASGHIVHSRGKDTIHRSYIEAEDCQIFVNDTPRGAFAGCQRYVDETNCLHVYLFNLEDGHDINTLATALDIPVDRIKLSSTLPKPDKIANASGKRVKTKCFVYSESGGGIQTRYHNSSYWKEDQHTFDDGGYYVQMHGYNVRSADDKALIQMGSFGQIVTKAKALDITIPTIIGVKTSHIKKYQKSKDWVNILDWLQAEVATYIKKNQMAKLYSYKCLLDCVKHSNIFTDIKLRKSLEKSSPVRQFGNKLRAYERMVSPWHQKIRQIDSLCQSLNGDLSQKLEQHPVPENKETTLIDTYPLLKCLIEDLDSYRPIVTTTQVADYINLVECQKAPLCV